MPIKTTLTGLKTTLTAKITLSTQIMSNTQEVTIEITPEGSIVHRHTSVLLDLKSRAIDLEFMNIIVDELPYLPYDIIRRYIFDSPHAKVSISGDVIGPTFMNNDPVSLYSMFPDGNGRFGKGTEFHAFNLASNTWQLHYLRLTNQLQSNWGLAKRVFEQMNIDYAATMRRFSSHGWVSIWDTAKPSVWLTSWCIKIFQHVSFQDWEDYIYVDPQVFGSAAMWLINYQNIDGAFAVNRHACGEDITDAKRFVQQLHDKTTMSQLKLRRKRRRAAVPARALRGRRDAFRTTSIAPCVARRGAQDVTGHLHLRRKSSSSD